MTDLKVNDKFFKGHDGDVILCPIGTASCVCLGGGGSNPNLNQPTIVSEMLEVPEQLHHHPVVLLICDMIDRLACVEVSCSDITNTLVGISGETAPDGGNLRIY